MRSFLVSILFGLMITPNLAQAEFNSNSFKCDPITIEEYQKCLTQVPEFISGTINEKSSHCDRLSNWTTTGGYNAWINCLDRSESVAQPVSVDLYNTLQFRLLYNLESKFMALTHLSRREITISFLAVSKNNFEFLYRFFVEANSIAERTQLDLSHLNLGKYNSIIFVITPEPNSIEKAYYWVAGSDEYRDRGLYGGGEYSPDKLYFKSFIGDSPEERAASFIRGLSDIK